MKAIGLGIGLTLALSITAPVKAEDVDLTLGCRGTEVQIYTSKRNYAPDPPENRKVDFSAAVTAYSKNVVIILSGDGIIGSVSSAPHDGKFTTDNSFGDIWYIRSVINVTGRMLDEQVVLNRLNGRISYSFRSESSTGIIENRIEALCEKLSPEKRKF